MEGKREFGGKCQLIIFQDKKENDRKVPEFPKQELLVDGWIEWHKFHKTEKIGGERERSNGLDLNEEEGRHLNHLSSRKKVVGEEKFSINQRSAEAMFSP